MQDSFLSVTICRCLNWCRQTMRAEGLRRLCILRSNRRMRKSTYCWLMRLSQKRCSSLMTKRIIRSCLQRNTKRTIPSRTTRCGMGYLQWWYFFRQYSKCTVASFCKVNPNKNILPSIFNIFIEKLFLSFFLFSVFYRRYRRNIIYSS